MRVLISLGLIAGFCGAGCDNSKPPSAEPPQARSTAAAKTAAAKTAAADDTATNAGAPSSDRPDEAAWGRARQLKVEALADYNCTARMLPPWLRVSCTTRANNSGVVEFDGMPGAKATQRQLGKGDEGPIHNTITFRLKEGGMVKVSAGHFYVPSEKEVAEAEARAKAAPSDTVAIPQMHAHNVTFSFKWAGGQGEPEVAGGL